MDAAGNMSLFGGVFFMPVAYYIAAKIIKCKVSDLFDICTICMLFTVMCARINCILTGCCQGILFGGIQGLRWPTRELEIVYYIALLICFGHKVKSGRSDGEIYPLYMISYGVFRFIIEWVRSYDGNSLIHRAHFWALISLCLGFSIYAEIEKKKTKRRR